MALNPTKQKGDISDHLNYMSAPSWDVSDPIDRLRMAAASCFFGEPQYYVEASTGSKVRARRNTNYGLSTREVSELDRYLNALDPQEWRGLGAKERMEAAIDAALKHDVERTLQVAVALRQEDNIRTTPQVIMVRAANLPEAKGTGLVLKYASQIMHRADEPSVQMAYQLATYGKPIPNQLKKAWRNFLASQSDYGLAKYQMSSRTVKTLDVANLVHPGSSSVNRMMTGSLQPADTWEVELSKSGNTKEAWADAYPKMGHMALLRNLRNLITKSELDQTDIGQKLLSGVDGGRQLPFRYWSAYQAVKDSAKPVLLDAIDDSVRQSCADLKLPGRIISLCDNSGSAWGAMTSEWGSTYIAEIANLTACLTALAAEHGEVGVFGDRLETFTVSHRSSIFDLVDKTNKLGSNIGAGTENGIWLFWDKAIRQVEHYDSVFIYSDMQAGHGGLYGRNHLDYRNYAWNSRYIHVPKLINEYRNKVNPNVEVFLVQVAGYQDTIVPEHYHRTHILGGWSDGILRYAQKVLVRPTQ